MLQIQLSLNFEIQSMILDNDETQTRLLTTIIKPLTLMFVLRNPISTIYISAKHGAKAAIKSSLNSIFQFIFFQERFQRNQYQKRIVYPL